MFIATGQDAANVAESTTCTGATARRSSNAAPKTQPVALASLA